MTGESIQKRRDPPRIICEEEEEDTRERERERIRERETERERERDGERERETERERERDGEKIIEDALNGNFTSSFRSRSERKRTSVQSLFQTTATGASVSFPPQ